MAYDNFGGQAEPPARVPLPSPLRWVIAAGVGLILVVAAFVGGWTTGRAAPKTPTVFRGMPIAPAPADWLEWKYPNSEVKGLAAGGTSTFGGAQVGAAHTVQLVTPDSIELVLAFYAGLFGQPAMTSPTAATNGSAVRGVPRGTEVCSWAETVVTRPGVRGKIINYRTTNYDVVVVVTRADAERHTHVLVSYMPNP